MARGLRASVALVQTWRPVTLTDSDDSLRGAMEVRMRRSRATRLPASTSERISVVQSTPEIEKNRYDLLSPCTTIFHSYQAITSLISAWGLGVGSSNLPAPTKFQ